MMPVMNETVSGAVMQLLHTKPYFGILAMHAGYEATMEVRIMATDGMTVYFNPVSIQQLTRRELVGVLMHEILHAALRHPGRRGIRERYLWNIACDFVVNLLIRDAEIDLPAGALRSERWRNMSAEEVYDVLRKEGKLGKDDSGSSELMLDPPALNEVAVEGSRPGSVAPTAELHWHQALTAAMAGSSSGSAGHLPAGVRLAFNASLEPQVDWRLLLWSALSSIPSDYNGFDKRLIHSDLYVDALESEGLEVHVAIDTSGSAVSWIGHFMAELRQIIQSYPAVRANLSYVDAAVYGPWDVDSIEDLPIPVGGGGTSFNAYFEHLEERGAVTGVVIYMTDGYAAFPTEPPPYPVIWVVTPGGRRAEEFPFGQVVILSES